MTNTLEHELRQFTGSEVFFRHSLFKKYVFTEGVQYLAERAEAYWLIEFIFANQHIQKIAAEPFQAWIIKLKDDKTAIIHVEDGNKNQVRRFKLDYTDFPLKEFTLWFIDGTLLLPSEY